MSKKSFRGIVKPHVYVQEVGKNLHYGQIVDLEPWQWNTENFKMLLEKKCVMKVSFRDKIWNTLEQKSKKVLSRPKVITRNEPTPFKAKTKPEPQVIDSTFVKRMLEHQTRIIANIQRSYDAIRDDISKEYEIKAIVKAEPNPEMDKILKEMVVSQKLLMDLINTKLDKTDKSENLLTQIKEELKKSPNVKEDKLLEALKDIKVALENKKFVYNKDGMEKDFSIKNFEQTYIPKVESLNAKDSKIFKESHKASGIGDALAALKKLKGKK